jgi:hypothetical protein
MHKILAALVYFTNMTECFDYVYRLIMKPYLIREKLWYLTSERKLTTLPRYQAIAVVYKGLLSAEILLALVYLQKIKFEKHIHNSLEFVNQEMRKFRSRQAKFYCFTHTKKPCQKEFYNSMRLRKDQYFGQFYAAIIPSLIRSSYSSSLPGSW